MKVNEFEQGAEAAVDLLRSLAHQGRLMILCQLIEGEKSVSTLTNQIGMRQASVSQQLSLLRREGIVSQRRDGRQVFYRLTDPNAGAVVKTLYDLFCPQKP
ncbi:MAG: metalloregulator ArsR/SmtB family transcription factor [Sphingomonadales bacterium]|jgi:ArsR family transcriptional regulator